MEEKKITVIVPVYNTAEYLERCLKSIINNTYENLEIICVNDGSTDNSLGILKFFAKKDERIILINKDNGGVSSARNTALDMVTGDFVAFVDSDDWIHKEFFKTLMEYQNDADIVAAKYRNLYFRIEDENVGETQNCFLESPDKIFQNEYLRKYVWGRVYRADLLRELRFEEEMSFGEDTIFNVSLLSEVRELRAVLIENPLYFYCNRESQATRVAHYQTYLKMSKWYLAHIDGYEKTEFFCVEAYRTVLLYRYITYILKDKEGLEVSKEVVRSCARCVFRQKNLSYGKKWKYSLAFLSPRLYRLVCVAKDKTLLDWEEMIKVQYKL